MASSLDMTLCRRCDQPMAAVISAAALPRYVCRLCGDLALPARPPAVGPAPAGDLAQFIARPVEEIGLRLDVVVCRSPIPPSGELLHHPPSGNSNQFPLHRTQPPQRDW